MYKVFLLCANRTVSLQFVMNHERFAFLVFLAGPDEDEKWARAVRSSSLLCVCSCTVAGENGVLYY